MRDEGAAEADVYDCQRLQNALAKDPRVSTLGLEVRLVGGGQLLVCGEVTTPEQRDAVAQVAAEELPGHRLQNQVTVTPVGNTVKVEDLS